MSAEERLLEAIEEEDEEECLMVETPGWRERQARRLKQRNRPAINRFLGRGRRTNQVVILPRYYGELLTWALHQYLQRQGWKVAATLGYRGPEPVFTDVDTGGKTENLLVDGQLLIEVSVLTSMSRWLQDCSISLDSCSILGRSCVNSDKASLISLWSFSRFNPSRNSIAELSMTLRKLSILC